MMHNTTQSSNMRCSSSPPLPYTVRSSGSEARAIAREPTAGSSRPISGSSERCLLTLSGRNTQVERAHGPPGETVFASHGGRADGGRLQRFLQLLDGKASYRLAAHHLHAQAAPRPVPAHLPGRMGPHRPAIYPQRRRLPGFQAARDGGRS